MSTFFKKKMIPKLLFLLKYRIQSYYLLELKVYGNVDAEKIVECQLDGNEK